MRVCACACVCDTLHCCSSCISFWACRTLSNCSLSHTQLTVNVDPVASVKQTVKAPVVHAAVVAHVAVGVTANVDPNALVKKEQAARNKLTWLEYAYEKNKLFVLAIVMSAAFTSVSIFFPINFLLNPKL